METDSRRSGGVLLTYSWLRVVNVFKGVRSWDRNSEDGLVMHLQKGENIGYLKEQIVISFWQRLGVGRYSQRAARYLKTMACSRQQMQVIEEMMMRENKRIDVIRDSLEVSCGLCLARIRETRITQINPIPIDIPDAAQDTLFIDGYWERQGMFSLSESQLLTSSQNSVWLSTIETRLLLMIGMLAINEVQLERRQSKDSAFEMKLEISFFSQLQMVVIIGKETVTVLSRGWGTVQGKVLQIGARMVGATEELRVSHWVIIVSMQVFMVGKAALQGTPRLEALTVNPFSPFLSCLMLFTKDILTADILEEI